MSQTVAIVLPLPVAFALVILLLILVVLSAVALSLGGPELLRGTDDGERRGSTAGAAPPD